MSFFELTVCATGMAAPERVVLAHELGLLVLGDVLLVLAVSEAIRGIKPKSESRAERAHRSANGLASFAPRPAGSPSRRPPRQMVSPCSTSIEPG